MYFLLLFFNIYRSVFKGLVTNSGMKTRCNSQQVWWQYWYDSCVQILILIQS